MFGRGDGRWLGGVAGTATEAPEQIPTTDGHLPATTPTWFGDQAKPLFGVVHVPPGGLARGGIVICPPAGKELVDSYRGVKLLAQHLCDMGFAVLRFDYLGTGDSAMTQREDSAIANYLDSVEEAVAYLRHSGVRTVGLVGLRLGALLAAKAAPRLGELASLVLWDPVTDGRRYLREQRTLYKMTVGDDVVDVDGESILGTSFSRVASAELKSTQFPPVPTSVARTLLAVRAERKDDVRLAPMSGAPNCTVLEVEGQAKFVEPMSFVVEIPVAAVTAIAGWIDDAMPNARDAVKPTIRREAVVAGWGTRRPIVESLEELGPNRLFAIRTSTADAAPNPPTLLIHNTACEHRIGTGRVWAEGSRDLAGLGLAVIRYDRRGTGETGIATPEFARIHSKLSKADVLDAMSAAGVEPERLMMTGVCSGAWHSAYGASERGARAVVLINIILYSLRRVEVGPEKLIGLTPPPGIEVAESEPRTLDQRAKKLIRRWTPYRIWLLAGRLGLTQVPEVFLRRLQLADVGADLVLSPQDFDWFAKQRGSEAISRLARDGWSPRIFPAPTGDHPLLQRDIQNFARRQITEAVLREFGAELSVPTLEVDVLEAGQVPQFGHG